MISHVRLNVESITTQMSIKYARVAIAIVKTALDLFFLNVQYVMLDIICYQMELNVLTHVPQDILRIQ